MHNVSGQSLEPVDIAPRRTPRSEVRRKPVNRCAERFHQLLASGIFGDVILRHQSRVGSTARKTASPQNTASDVATNPLPRKSHFRRRRLFLQFAFSGSDAVCRPTLYHADRWLDHVSCRTQQRSKIQSEIRLFESMRIAAGARSFTTCIAVRGKSDCFKLLGRPLTRVIVEL